MDENKAREQFEEIYDLNALDISNVCAMDIDLSKFNNAVSTFATYKNTRTELLWRFFWFGCKAEMDN